MTFILFPLHIQSLCGFKSVVLIHFDGTFVVVLVLNNSNSHLHLLCKKVARMFFKFFSFVFH